MPASFQEILNSRLFKFIVGENVDENPTEFLVHEEAIAQLSASLYALMKGGMAESQAGCAIWADVSKETFERFVQFAYTGDYSIPKGGKRDYVTLQKSVTGGSSASSHQKLLGSLDKTKSDPELAVEKADPGPSLGWNFQPKEVEELKRDDIWGSTFSKKDKNKRKSVWEIESPAPIVDPDLEQESVQVTKRDKYPERHSRVHSEDFRSLTFPLLTPRNNHDKTCEPAEKFKPNQSYTEVFLSHASLYILGDLQLIDSLKALALFKLHKALCVFQLDDGNAEDIVALARYAYSEEGGGGALDEGIGGLRILVCQYMATNAVVLSFNDGFMDLLGEGGQLVKDFFKYEVQRIN